MPRCPLLGSTPVNLSPKIGRQALTYAHMHIFVFHIYLWMLKIVTFCIYIFFKSNQSKSKIVARSGILAITHKRPLLGRQPIVLRLCKRCVLILCQTALLYYKSCGTIIPLTTIVLSEARNLQVHDCVASLKSHGKTSVVYKEH